jgi:hypothetical protein
MQRLGFAGNLNGRIDLDLCFTCQALWFDRHESTQIAPEGVIELFRLIHENRQQLRHPLAASLRCPRCTDRLGHTFDMGKSGRFNYYRCPQTHGRFTPFAQLMTEKGFVRQLAPLEIQTLAARVHSIHCGSCGAPFDIRKEAACPFCRSPITLLDPQAVEQALARYRQAETRRHQRDPLLIADALLSSERERERQKLKPKSTEPHALGEILDSGLDVVWQLFDL